MAAVASMVVAMEAGTEVAGMVSMVSAGGLGVANVVEEAPMAADTGVKTLVTEVLVVGVRGVQVER